MKAIDIAMATYNGSKYLEQQIASIQNQSFTNWELYISDDGSCDDTLNIISRLCNNDHRIKLINTERQGGVVNNFNRVLCETSADYVALCDQDDIWPEDRLEKLHKFIISKENRDKSEPVMVFTDLELVKENGLQTMKSYYIENGFNPEDNLNIEQLKWFSTVYGCSTIMNRRLLDIALPIPPEVTMHDHWLALKALINRGLYFYDIKSVLYRQHENNAVGGSVKGLKGKMYNFKRNLKAISLNVDKIKKMHELLKPDCVSVRKLDYILFALKNVLPRIFKGNKKTYAFFFFLFVIAKQYD